jgi:hypothetical protein
MPRQLSISYARFLADPTAVFDLATGNGVVSVSYTVGEAIFNTGVIGTNPDGTSIMGQVPFYTDHPTAVINGFAQVLLGPTDTAAMKVQQLVGVILQQEKLSVSKGDHVFDIEGKQIV